MRDGRRPFFATAELAALMRVNQTHDAQIVIGALRLAKPFPLFDAGAPCPLVFELLSRLRNHPRYRSFCKSGRRICCRCIFLDDLPRLRRCRHRREGGTKAKAAIAKTIFIVCCLSCEKFPVLDLTPGLARMQR